MANKKRKTLQIKRPSAAKRPTPKKSGNGPKDAGNNDVQNSKGATTRVPLPDEDKIRKARGEDASGDLKNEEQMPTADQIAQADNNATMAIEIDENVLASSQKLPDAGASDDSDQTMQINADDLMAADGQEEVKGAGTPENSNDQTLEINTGDVKKEKRPETT